MTEADVDLALAVLRDLYVPLAVVMLLVCVLLLYLGRHKIRRTWLNLKTRHLLNHLGLKTIANASFPDGLGNQFTVDRLILRQDGISLLVFIRYPGSIFCADDISEWTQLLVGKSYRFKNPLIELDHQIKAIASLVPDVPVDGFLFFDHQARFPKGHPERVIYLNNVPQSLKCDKKGKVKAPVQSAWDTLVGLNATA